MPGGQKHTRDGRVILRIDPATLKPVFDSFKTFIGENPIDTERLTNVKELIDWLQDCCQPPPRLSVPATNFDSITTAANAVEVIYDRHSERHVWQLRENDYLSHSQLSEWADTCIRELQSSPYFQLADSESTCRTVLDVIFCDRLKCLHDNDAEKHLNWFPEVRLSVKSKLHNFLIQGRADWCLAYGSSKATLQTALIVLSVSSLFRQRVSELTPVRKAKKPGAVQSALPQLIIYLAAVQDSRKESKKINSSVFGLITDSEEYRFAWLDENRNLFVSETHLWVTKNVKIIQWIDNILRDSIEASPHTAPVKTANTAIQAYRSHVNRHFQFGDTDVVEAVEGEDLRHYRVVKKGPYGEVVTEMETDEE